MENGSTQTNVSTRPIIPHCEQERAFAIGTPVRILPVREDSAQYHGATGVIASVHDAHLDAEFLPVRIGAAILNFRRDELEASTPESEASR